MAVGIFPLAFAACVLVPAAAVAAIPLHRGWAAELHPQSFGFSATNADVSQPSAFTLQPPPAEAAATLYDDLRISYDVSASPTTSTTPTTYAPTPRSTEEGGAATRMNLTWFGSFEVPKAVNVSVTLLGCYQHDTTPVAPGVDTETPANTTYMHFFASSDPSKVLASIPVPKTHPRSHCIPSTADNNDAAVDFGTTTLAASVKLPSTVDSMRFLAPAVLPLLGSRAVLRLSKIEIRETLSTATASAVAVPADFIEAEAYNPGPLGAGYFTYEHAGMVLPNRSLFETGTAPNAIDRYPLPLRRIPVADGSQPLHPSAIGRVVVDVAPFKLAGMAFTVNVTQAGIYAIKCAAHNVFLFAWSDAFPTRAYALGSLSAAADHDDSGSDGTNVTLKAGVQQLWVYARRGPSGHVFFVDYINVTFREALPTYTDTTGGEPPAPDPIAVPWAAAVRGSDYSSITTFFAGASGNASRPRDHFTGADVYAAASDSAVTFVTLLASDSIHYDLNFTAAGEFTLSLTLATPSGFVESASLVLTVSLDGVPVVASHAIAVTPQTPALFSVSVPGVRLPWLGVRRLSVKITATRSSIGAIGLASFTIGSRVRGPFFPPATADLLRVPGFIPAWRFDECYTDGCANDVRTATAFVVVNATNAGNRSAASVRGGATAGRMQFDWSPTFNMPTVHDWSAGETLIYTLGRADARTMPIGRPRVRIVAECRADASADMRLYACFGFAGCRDHVSTPAASEASGWLLHCGRPGEVVTSDVEVPTWIDATSGVDMASNTYEFALRIDGTTAAAAASINLIGAWVYTLTAAVFPSFALPNRTISPAVVANTTEIPELNSAPLTDPDEPTALRNNASRTRIGAPVTFVVDSESGMPCVPGAAFGGVARLRSDYQGPTSQLFKSHTVHTAGRYEVLLWGRARESGFIGGLDAQSNAAAGGAFHRQSVDLVAAHAGLLSGARAATIDVPYAGSLTFSVSFQTTNLVSLCAVGLRFVADASGSDTATNVIPHDPEQDPAQMYAFTTDTPLSAVPAAGMSPFTNTSHFTFDMTVRAAGTYRLVCFFRHRQNRDQWQPQYGLSTFAFSGDGVVDGPTTLRFTPNPVSDVVANSASNQADGQPLRFMHTGDTLRVDRSDAVVRVAVALGGVNVRLLGIRLEGTAAFDAAGCPSSSRVHQSTAELCPLEASQAAANMTGCTLNGGVFAHLFPSSSSSSPTPRGCVAANRGSSIDLSPPQPVVAATGIALHLAREEATPSTSISSNATTSTLSTGGVLSRGDILSNGRIELRMLEDGVSLVQVDVTPEQRLAAIPLIGLTTLRLAVDGLRLTGEHQFRLIEGVRQLSLADCRVELTSRDGSTSAQHLFFPPASCVTRGGDARTRVVVEYASGLVERVATITNIPNVATTLFVPRNLTELTAAPLATCAGAREAAGASVSRAVVGFVGFLPNETVTRVRLISHDGAGERVVLLEVAWLLSGAASCPDVPRYGGAAAMPMGESIYGVDATTTEAASSSLLFISNFETAHGCSLLANAPTAWNTQNRSVAIAAAAWWTLSSGVGASAGTPRFSCLPETGAALPLTAIPTTVQTRSDFTRQGFYSSLRGAKWHHHTPTAAAGDAGFQQRLLFTSASARIDVAGVRSYAVFVPAAFVSSSDDWVGVVSPVTAHQCGWAFEPFGGASSSPSSSSCTTSTGYVHCGATRVDDDTDASGPLTYFTTSETHAGTPAAGSTAACNAAAASDAFHAIVAVNGTSVVQPAVTVPYQLYDAQNYTLIPTVAVIDATVTTDNNVGPYGRVHTDRVAPELLADGFLCEFRDATGFVAEAATGVAACAVETPLVSGVGQLAVLCEADSTCVGFTTTNTGRPGCLLRSAAFNRTSDASSSLWLRRAAAERLCTWTAPRAYGFLTANAFSIDLAAALNVVSVDVNGEPVGQCGGARGMADGSSGGRGQCTQMRECLAMPVRVSAGDTVRVRIPRTMASVAGGDCDGIAARVKIELARLGSDLVHATAALTHVRVLQFTVGVPRAVTFRATPSRVALQMLYSGCPTCAPPLRVSRVASADVNTSSSSVVVCGGAAMTSWSTADDADDARSPPCGVAVVCTSNQRQAVPTASLFAPASPQHTTSTTSDFIRVEYVPPPSNSSAAECFAGTRFSVAVLMDAPQAATVVNDGRSTSDVRSFSLVRRNATAATEAGNLTRRPPIVLPVPSALSTSEPLEFVDDLSVPETDKRLDIGTATAACLVDVFTSSASLSCRLPLQTTATTNNNTNGSSFLVVRVLQSVFADSTAAVTVAVGSASVTCGGSRLFRGSTGASDRCSTYQVCYAGPVGPGVTHATVTFSPPVSGTTTPCVAQGLAMGTVSRLTADEGSVTALRRADDGCASSSSLFCPLTGECLATPRLCDGVNDCPDASDEAFCSQNRLVAFNQVPLLCSANATMPVPAGTGIIEWNDCLLWAVAHQVRGSFDPAFAFVEHELCVAYTCFDIASPASTLVNITASREGHRPVEFYAHVEQPDDYELCTAALHCNGNGIPGSSSSRPPCACVCDDAYTGDACDVRKTMAATATVVVRLNTDNDAGLTAAAASALLLGLSSDLPSQYTVSQQASLRISADLLHVEYDVTNPAATAQDLAAARLRLLTPAARAAVASRLAATTAGAFRVRELTAANDVLSKQASLVESLNFVNSTYASLGSSFGGEPPTVPLAAPLGYSSSRLRTAAVPPDARVTKVVFSVLGAHDRIESVVTYAVNGQPCSTLELTTEDATLEFSSACQKRTVCTYYPPDGAALAYNATLASASNTPPGYGSTEGFLSYSLERTTALPELTSATTLNTCTVPTVNGMSVGNTNNRPVLVEWHYVVQLVTTEAPVRDVVATAETTFPRPAALGEPVSNRMELSSDAILSGIVGGVLLVVAAVAAVVGTRYYLGLPPASSIDPATASDHAKRSDSLGSVCRWLSCCLVAVLGAVYPFFVVLDDLQHVEPSHALVIDEYRSEQCERSDVTFAPMRSSLLAASGRCVRVQSFGASEGQGYARALCGSSGSVDGTMRIAFGNTLDECEAAAWIDVRAPTCYTESTFFPAKLPAELQFVQFGCWPKSAAKARFEYIAAQLNPTLQPSVAAVPSETRAATSVVAGPSTGRVYHLAAPTELQPLRRRSTSSVALAAFAEGADVDAINATRHASDARLERVEFVDPDGVVHPVSKALAAVSDQGIAFNGFGGPDERSSLEAAAGAYRYRGLDRDPWFDIGAKLSRDKTVTITLWLKADARTRGFAFFVGDDWHNRQNFRSPMIERLLDGLEASSATAAGTFFPQQWRAYYGLYVSGRERTLRFVMAGPNEVVVDLAFDTTLPTMAGLGRVFDGDWHQIALALPSYAGSRRYAQLFVDGETSYTKEGWRQCFPGGRSVTPFTRLGESVPVFSAVDEAASRGPVAYVGHLNGGVYNLEVHDGFLEQERIIGYGSDGMKRYAIIDATRANVLAFTLLGVAAVGTIVAVVLLVVVRRDAAEDTPDAAGAISDGAEAASTNVSAVAASRGIHDASDLRHFVPNVLRVAQTMALYIHGWRWPAQYAVAWVYIAIPLSFNLDIAFGDFHALAGPLAQFVAALLLVVVLLWISAKDKGRFEVTVIARAVAARQKEHHAALTASVKVKAALEEAMGGATASSTNKQHTQQHTPQAAAPAEDAACPPLHHGEHTLPRTPHPASQQAAVVEVDAPPPPTTADAPHHFDHGWPDPSGPSSDRYRLLFELRRGGQGDATPAAHVRHFLATRHSSHILADALEQCVTHPVASTANGGLVSDVVTITCAVNGRAPPTPLRTGAESKDVQRRHAADDDAGSDREPSSGDGTDAVIEMCGVVIVTPPQPSNSGSSVGSAVFVEHQADGTTTQTKSAAPSFGITVVTHAPDLCPRHHAPLVRAVEAIHSKVRAADGESPYRCCCRDRSVWYALLGKERHVCIGVTEPDNYFVCPEPSCAFTVCRSCATDLGRLGRLAAGIRGQQYAASRMGALGFFGVIVVTLLLLLFLPVMQSGLTILTCRPEWQCEFPQCYADFAGLFATAVVYSAVTVAVVGLFLLSFLLVSLVRRKLHVVHSGVFDSLFDGGNRPTALLSKLFADVPSDEWASVLEYDKTMLASLYDGYSFRWMCVAGPLDLVFKILLILPVILPEPNTLEQLGGAALVEVLQLIYFLGANAFVNQWLNALAQFGSLHQIAQLGLMALHRVAVNRDPDAEGMALFMIAVSCVYAALLLVIFIRVVVAPAVRDMGARRSAREKAQCEADAAFAEDRQRHSAQLRRD